MQADKLWLNVVSPRSYASAAVRIFKLYDEVDVHEGGTLGSSVAMLATFPKPKSYKS